MAFPGDYTLYDEYVVQSSKVTGSGTHTDFPVFVDMADLSSQFWSNVKSDGGDIRVTLDDGTTQVPVEVVAIDTVGETGELHFKGDLNTASNTTFRIWYNGTDATPSVTSTYGRNNVWTGFDAVWHLEEDPSGSSPQMTDSTGNGNDGTSRGTMTSGDSVAGAFGGGNCLQFDGSDDYIDANGYSPDRSGDFDYSFWMNSDNSSQTARLIGDFNNSSTWTRVDLSAQGDIDAYLDDGTTLVSINFDENYDLAGWHTIHVRRDGTTFELFGDAVSKGTATEGDDCTSTDNWEIGSGGDVGGFPFEGKIDEVRVKAGSFRSDDWITTEYDNQNNHATWAVVTAKSDGGGGTILPYVMHLMT